MKRHARHVYGTVGDGAFRARTTAGGASRNLNKALFDSIMIPAAFADKNAMLERAEGVRELRDELLTEPEFLASIGRATADRTRMIYRIKRFSDGLVDLGIPVDLPTLEG